MAIEKAPRVDRIVVAGNEVEFGTARPVGVMLITDVIEIPAGELCVLTSVQNIERTLREQLELRKAEKPGKK